MYFLALSFDSPSGLPLIAAAGLAMYIASKALADALVGGRANQPGRLAIGQWLPIATLAVAATMTHRQPLAIGVLFSTAVASLSLATGAVGFLGVTLIPAGWRRSWAMLVPVALLTFLAGFRASISLFNAGVLALQGVCVLLLWNDREEATAQPPAERAGRGIAFRIAQIILGLMLAAVGSWFAMHGIDRVAAGAEFASSGLLATTLLGPLLVLPIIGTGTELSQRNQSAMAITAQVGVALLNLCALLPIVVCTAALQQMRMNRSLSTDHLTGFPFPLAVWRVDVVMLIALGLFLLPVALGKWSISKVQGIGLMFGYAVYLALSILISLLRI